MAHQSEAACLLQTGSMYTRRVGLRPKSGHGENDVVLAGFKLGAFSLYYGDEPIYHFDLEGRWQRAYLAGTHYLKGLDGATVAVDRVREGANLVLRRRALAFAESSDLDAAIRATALDLLDGLAAQRLERLDPPAPTRTIADDELRSFLEEIARWDAAAWFAHRERYAATYGPLSFLPPEAQQSVVLQATLGHAGGITFGLAPAHEHYVRSAQEFDEHARAVAAILGRRVLQCRNIYVGGSDVLLRREADETEWLDTAVCYFPIDASATGKRLTERDEQTAPLDGVCLFVDQFEPGLPDRSVLGGLRERLLKRITLGIESGDAGVRRVYSKTWADGDLASFVAALKGAQIDVSVVLLVGAGGRQSASEHVAASSALLNSLPLGPTDIVYLLDANEVGGEHARAELARRGLETLSAQEAQEQQAELRAQLAPLRSERKVKIVPYTLEKLWT